MKILIGFDGSQYADAALADLKRAGLPKQAQVMVVCVAERWLPPPPPSSYEIVAQAQQVRAPADLRRVYSKNCSAAKSALALAQAAGDRIKSDFPQWEVRADSWCGSPAWEIIYEADNWKPDLIVVGSHGRSGLGRFVLGSVSQRVLTEARCSVRIARGQDVEVDRPVKIIIGVDGSLGSTAAVRAASKRTWPQNSEAALVVVDDPFLPESVGTLVPPLAHLIEEDKQNELAWAARIAKQAAALLDRSPIKVTQVLRQGDPKRELPKAAQEWGADCIFVGSAGFSNRFERFVLGSVSAAVAARAHCTVEVVRNNAE